MKTLTIFHDPDCGLCANFKRWLITQESYPTLQFIPYNSDKARARLPIIDELDGGEEIIVLADDGRWWQGPAAWLTCLWALRSYREWSFRLATPALLPTVERFCHLLSENRLKASHLLHLKPERLTHIVDQLTPTYSQNTCRSTPLQRAKLTAIKEISH